MIEAKQITWMKYQIKSLKIMPMIMSILFVINTFLGYFGIGQLLINTLSGISIIPLIYLYISSYALGFCGYHRMFLHHIAVSNLFCLIDVIIGIPISGTAMFASLWVIAGVFLIVILYQWLHSK